MFSGAPVSGSPATVKLKSPSDRTSAGKLTTTAFPSGVTDARTLFCDQISRPSAFAREVRKEVKLSSVKVSENLTSEVFGVSVRFGVFAALRTSPGSNVIVAVLRGGNN